MDLASPGSTPRWKPIIKAQLAGIGRSASAITTFRASGSLAKGALVHV